MEKINVAELLRNCPKGMELDCYLFDGLEFDYIDTDNENYPIVCRAKNSSGEYYGHTFTKYGWYTSHYDYAKCVIFPKGKTTWEGFKRPYTNGDIVCTINDSIVILGNRIGEHSTSFNSYCGLFNNYEFDFNVIVAPKRLATEEEKQKLFQVIKNNGCKWNAETKTLEKLVEPKFKVGDRVRDKCTNNSYTICHITSTEYKLTNGTSFAFNAEDCYELAPNKFDITILKPFESKVLVRDYGHSLWQPSLWGLYDKEHMFPYITIGSRYKQCIPYIGNEHLLGTANDCDEHFKTWK